MPIRAWPIAIGRDYLATMRIPLVRREVFHGTIINESAGRRYWSTGDPVGQRNSFELDRPQWLQVVEVVGDVKHRGLDADADPEVYLSYTQTAVVGSTRAMTVVARTHLPGDAVAPLLRTAVREIDRQQPTGAIQMMDDLVAESVAPQRLNLWLIVVFAAIALVLTAEGIYGVTAYLVVQRTHEIGVRVALGAPPARILLLVLRQASVMTGIGIAVGLVGALGMLHSVTKSFVLTSTKNVVDTPSMKTLRRKPTDAELAILRVLWARGPSTVRQVAEVLGSDTGYTTVLKLLQIMAEKGLVVRDESARTHVYDAAYTEDQTQRQLVTDLLDRAFGGSAAKLVMQALSTNKASPEELAEIRKLLDKDKERGGHR